MLQLRRQICPRLVSSREIISIKMASRLKITRKNSRDQEQVVREAKEATLEVVIMSNLEKGEEMVRVKEPDPMKDVVEVEVEAEEEAMVRKIDLKSQRVRLVLTVVKKIILQETAQLQRKSLVIKMKVHQESQEKRERENQDLHQLRLATSATRQVTSPRNVLKIFRTSVTTVTRQVILLKIAQIRPLKRTNLQENQESQESRGNKESLERAMIIRRITKRARLLM